MQAGTTTKYTAGRVCTWHLISQSQFHILKKLSLSFNLTMSPSTNLANVYAKVYIGESYEDIVRNKAGTKEVNVTKGFEVIEVEAHLHVVIVAMAMEDLAAFSFKYQLVDVREFWWYFVFLGAGIVAIIVFIAVCIYIPLSLLVKK